MQESVPTFFFRRLIIKKVTKHFIQQVRNITMPIIQKQWTAQWKAALMNVGLGVLFGLELYRYEFAGLLMHAEHLEAVHGVGPHTISVPRIKHADDIDPSALITVSVMKLFAEKSVH